MMLQKTHENLLDFKETKPVNHKINPQHSLEGLMLKWKFQILWPPEWRAESLEKTLMVAGIGGKRRMGERLRAGEGSNRG